MKIEPVDLHLRIKTRHQEGYTLLRFELSSPSEQTEFFRCEGESHKLPLEPTPLSWLLLGEMENLLNGLWYAEPLLEPEIENRLRAIGKSLYGELLPESLQQILDRPSMEGKALLVETDETWIPWELLHTMGEGGDFLCLRYRMGRWLADFGAPDPIGPASSFAVHRLLCIDAGAAEYPELPQTAKETALIQVLGKRLELDLISLDRPNYGVVMDHLRQGGFQLLHFAGHGRFREGDSTHRANLTLEQQSLTPIDLIDEVEKRIREDRPLVFLNACRAARQGMSLTGLGGWPRAFVGRGRCGAFLAPQWTVSDDRAFEIAASFYQYVEQGLALGEAVRRARLPRAGHLEPTSLAYAFYGHPNAVVIWENRTEHGIPCPEPQRLPDRAYVVKQKTDAEETVLSPLDLPKGTPKGSSRPLAYVAASAALLGAFLIAAEFLYPTHPGASQERAAAAAIQERDYEKARVRLEKSVELEPGRASAWNSLGLVYGALDDDVRAVKALERAITLRPQEPLFHFNLGVAQAEGDDPESALRAYDRALELDPDYAGAWNNRGVLLLDKGDLEAATSALDKANDTVRLGRDLLLEIIIRKNQGRLALARGDTDTAVRLLEGAAAKLDARENSAPLTDALYHLAAARTRAGAADAACAAWRRYTKTVASPRPPPGDLECPLAKDASAVTAAGAPTTPMAVVLDQRGSEVLAVVTEIAGDVAFREPNAREQVPVRAFDLLETNTQLVLGEASRIVLFCAGRLVRIETNERASRYLLDHERCREGEAMTSAYDDAERLVSHLRLRTLADNPVLEGSYRSEKKTFLLRPHCPLEPGLSPADLPCAYVLSSRPDLIWRQVDRAVEYRLQAGVAAARYVHRVRQDGLECRAHSRLGESVCRFSWPSEWPSLTAGTAVFLTLEHRASLFESWSEGQTTPSVLLLLDDPDATDVRRGMVEVEKYIAPGPGRAFLLAGLLTSRRLLNEAADLLEVALESHPSSELQIALGDVYRRQSLFEAAENQYHGVLSSGQDPRLRSAAKEGLAWIEVLRESSGGSLEYE